MTKPANRLALKKRAAFQHLGGPQFATYVVAFWEVTRAHTHHTQRICVVVWTQGNRVQMILGLGPFVLSNFEVNARGVVTLASETWQ